MTVSIYNLAEAEEFLERHIKETINLRNSKSYRDHVYGVSSLSKDTGEKLGLNSERLGIAGMLHDTGKLITNDLYNETHVGASYLKELGLDWIADDIKTHFTCKELIDLQLEENEEVFRKLFPNLNSVDYETKTLAQKVITYADMCFGTERMKPEGRLEDVRKRYGLGTPLYEKYPLFVESIDKGRARLLEICREIDSRLV